MEKPWGMLSLFTHFWSLQVAFTGRRSFWKTMIRFQLFKWIDPARGCDTEMYVASLWIRSFFLRWITADPSMDETIVCRDPWGSLVFSRPVSDYEWIHPFRGCRWHRHTCMWRLCEAGRFSYGESPRTPPLEETSLHRRSISVERPWGILSLITTCLPLWVKSSRQCRCRMSPTRGGIKNLFGKRWPRKRS